MDKKYIDLNGKPYGIEQSYDVKGEMIDKLQSRIKELESAIKTINCSNQHFIEIGEDKDPCFWQRKEWVEWILDLANNPISNTEENRE